MEKKTNLEKSLLEVSISPSKKEWSEEQEKAFKNLKSGLTIKGFRKGEAPENIARAHITSSEIFKIALQKMIKPLAANAAKQLGAEDKVLDHPSYDIIKISESELEVKFLYPIYPNIKLSKYKGLNIKYSLEEVTDKDVEAEIEQLRNKMSKTNIKKGKIENGDIVKFDFNGFVDKKEFEGGSAKDFVLEIGSGQFIKGFEENMIGLSKGDKKDISVTFPKDYNAEDLKGKPAIFKVNIKEVKAKEIPELNDEFAASVKINDIKTLKELKSYLKNIMTQEKEMKSKNLFMADFFKEVQTDTEMVVADQLIAKEGQQLLKNFANQLQTQQKMDLNTYIEKTGIKKEHLIGNFNTQAKARLKQSFIIAEISKLEKIKPSDEDFKRQYSKMAKVYGKTEEEIKKLIPQEQAQVTLMNELVINRLLELNKGSGKPASSSKTTTNKK